MAEQTSSHWPPPNGLTTQNLPRKDTVLTSSASTRIDAPAALVFETLLNVSNFEWNTWVPKISIQSQPSEHEELGRLQVGTLFTLHVIMNENKPTSETPTQVKVTDISTPDVQSSYVPKDVLESDGSYTADLSKVYRISWKVEGGFVARGLKTERFHEIIVLGENECEVRTWENQGGMLAYTVKFLYKKTLEEKFRLWCEDLKRECEKKAGRGGA